MFIFSFRHLIISNFKFLIFLLTLALFQAGADVDSQNNEGHTALMFAYNGKSQVVALAEKYREYLEVEADDRTRAIDEAYAEHRLVLGLLIAAKADTTIMDKENHLASDFDGFQVKSATDESSNTEL